ncbi:SelB translation factor [Delftia tsuruhatensis]|uniref:selenocysteine-specific translation elongation factor n=1 Tax=Delftia tsuruhatensis TaxID=180282 RepID=UPI001E7BBA65|nr:selenocysteine-specific translation elongation factor [Delftia tsuruhatensis]CAB5709541.1 SelB translation factor [Delftia tsuruhatensis]CAC9685261.1 SelB translation factor [Delftia tsuruhatensis]
MIIGTAGHIDHGKTTLVRALTGVDTDRLKEEKARGISIELGYAYTPLPDGEVLGIIDVPGHEKFVHTMAAGAVGIDHALLVVAADDGVMPQTREHLDILRLLGVREATVALTKADRAPPERLQQVTADIAELLAPTPLAGAPVFPTAAARPGDAGVARLREHLVARAQSRPARASDGLFRLAVDRSFTLPGQGTVVTGTVFGGRVRVGDALVHSASGTEVRVRSLHAQNQASEQGQAGQRCALNLSGIAKDEITRGDWIADARLLQASDRIDVRLHLLADAPPLAQWTPVHVHIGTARCTAHVALLQDQPLEPGEQAIVQLVLDAPVHTLPGDRLILRNAQASRTIAGGSVVDPFAPARKRRSPERQVWLQALESLVATGDATALIANAAHGIAVSQLARLSGHAASPGPLLARELPLAHGDRLLLDEGRWQQLRAQVLDSLARFHDRHPDEPGVNAARLRRIALSGLVHATHDALWKGLLDALLQDGGLAASGAWLHLPGHSVQLSAGETTLAQKLLPAIEAGRYDPPWVRDLARDHGSTEEAVRQLLRKLARQGQLFQVVKDLFYAASRMDELADLVRELASQAPDGEVQAHAFRDATGLGRKRAIQILECFDRIGYTRRLRDAHLLRPDVQWTSSHRADPSQEA